MTNSQIKFKIQKIKNYWHLLKAVYWTVRCGWPAKRLYVIGVTGTDGKTTTTTLIYEILKAAGHKVGMLTTVAAKFIDQDEKETEIDTGLHTTNPGSEVLQPILKRMADAGVTHVVLETTSHGLDQNRVWGCNYRIGVLTNVTHEHLDYHGTMEAYKQAKLKMFAGVKHAVLNEDESAFEYFNDKIQRLNNKSSTNNKIQVIKYKKTVIKNISPALGGDYNRYNIGAAETVAKILKIQDAKIQRVVGSFGGVPGRREEVTAGQKFRVVVDFAHTPNALKQILSSLRKQSKSKSMKKIMVVFGCTGERDKDKRPMMGKIAAELADVVIVTSDDARSEDQNEIYRQIEAGIADAWERKKQGKLFQENDRKKAIELAIGMAKAGDVVLLAGKGHEKSILIGKKEQPWSDVEVAKEILKRGQK